MARLVLKHEGHKSEHELGDVLTIGRQSTNDVVVLEERASRKHCRIVREGGAYVLQDLDSANGTYLNGAKVARQPLEHGDEIRIGNAVLTFQATEAAVNLEGTTLGNYRVHNKAGSGHLGTVYKATQVSMDRIVALKILRKDLTSDPDFVKTFLSEARTAGRLNHPNVVRVHEFGEADGAYFFSMEFVNGETLENLIARENTLPVRRALAITGDVAAALDHAHGLGILHGDVKPRDVLLDRSGVSKLTDIGMPRMGRRGDRRGDPSYMSPELCRGDRGDERSDIYSLGATLYHMLTGRPPFEADDEKAVMSSQIHDPPPSPRVYNPNVPGPVCDLIECMMAKNPSVRPQTAKAVVRKLEDAGQVEPAPASAVAAREPQAPSAGRAERDPETKRVRVVRIGGGSPVVNMLVGGLVVAIMGIVGIVMLTGKPSGGAANGRTGTNANRPSATATTRHEDRPTAAPVARTVEPVRAAGAPDERSEQEAASLLSAIRRDLQERPNTRDYALRRACNLLGQYGDTKAAAETWGLVVDLFGGEERVPPEVARLRPEAAGPRAAPSVPAPAGDPAAALREASDASGKAMNDGDFHAARRALTGFVREHGGTPQEGEAARLLADLDERIHKRLDMDYDRALSLSNLRKHSEATAILQDIVRKDPVGPDRERAQTLLSRNRESARAAHDRALEEARDRLSRCEFEEAAQALRSTAQSIGSAEFTAGLLSLAGATDICRSFVESFARKVADHRNDPPAVPWRATARSRRPVLSSATGEHLTLSDGPVQERLPWGEIPVDELRKFVDLFPVGPEDHLGLGAFLLVRGERAEALKELREALQDKQTRPKATALIQQVNESMKLRRFEFSGLEEGLTLDGAWEIEAGMLVYAGDGIGTAQVKDLSYRADGLELSFQVAFMDDGGLIEVQLGPDPEHCVWFALGSTGYQARCAVGDSVRDARDRWAMQPSTEYRVECLVIGNTLAVSVDARLMQSLEAPGLGGLEGPVTFRAQGSKLALDAIRILQGEAGKGAGGG